MRAELQFRKSEWYDLKSKIGQKHWKGKYVYHYNEQKVNDYNDKMENSWKKRKTERISRKLCRQVILGDTIFGVMPQITCYQCHASIANTLNEDCSGKGSSPYYWGWLLFDKTIEEMCEKEGVMNM